MTNLTMGTNLLNYADFDAYKQVNVDITNMHEEAISALYAKGEAYLEKLIGIPKEEFSKLPQVEQQRVIKQTGITGMYIKCRSPETSSSSKNILVWTLEFTYDETRLEIL